MMLVSKQNIQKSVAVLPLHCGPLSTGSIPGPGAVCPFGFQSKLASAGFSPGIPVFLLHLKLGFLDRSTVQSQLSGHDGTKLWLDNEIF